MRNLCYIIILLSVVFCSDVIAQRKTKVPVKKAKEPVVEVVDPRIEQMTLSTQKVIVIDSIVTSAENMLDKLLLSNESSGRERVNATVREELGELYPAYNAMKQIRDMKGVQARMPMEIVVR